MPIFQNKETPGDPLPLTSDRAKHIYGMLQLYGDPTTVFTQVGIDIPDSVIVLQEAKRIEKEILVVLADPNPPKTIGEVCAKVNSERLDVNVVLTDVIKYNPTYSSERKTVPQLIEALSATGD